MPEYRLYCANEAGRFAKAHEFRAATDEDAVALVRELKIPDVCELWQRDRMVAKFDQRDA
jgi:hypothetical protein